MFGRIEEVSLKPSTWHLRSHAKKQAANQPAKDR